MATKSYRKYNQSPIIVSLADKSTPIWDIPFPAVTICPETKSYIDLLNFTETFHLFQKNQSLDDVSNET